MNDKRKSEKKRIVHKRQRAGHYEILGETYAKFEFFEQGWNPYSRFLDVDKVDIILRRLASGKPIYREIQVKFGKLHRCGAKWEKALFDITSWRFFKKDEFDKFRNRSDFFIAYILAEDPGDTDHSGYNGDIFIFPVNEFAALIRAAIPSGDKMKVYLSRVKADPGRWVLRKLNSFADINDSTTVDVSRFRRKFSLLD